MLTLYISICLIPDIFKCHQWRLWEYRTLFKGMKRHYQLPWSYRCIKNSTHIYFGCELGQWRRMAA